METKDRKRIARELAKGVREALIATAEHAPTSWDGIEMRAALIEIAESYSPGNAMSPGRRKDFWAACYQHNLPRRG